MNNTNEQILEKYKSLPQDIKDSLFSMETAQILQKIGKDNGLDTKKTSLLAREVGDFMMGFSQPSNFIPNLRKVLGIDQNHAKKIAEEINNQVFSRIRESLKAIHNKKTSIKADVEPQTPNKNTEGVSRTRAETVEKNLPVKKENPYPNNYDPYREPLN